MKRPQIVILGAGFGGVFVAKNLRKAIKRGEVDVTIINRTNSFLFTPLLHEVATGGLNPRNVAEPLREIFVGTNIRIIQGWVESIDSKNRTLSIKADGDITTSLVYDYLVIATGAETAYYGIAGAQEHALPLKTLADAARIRNRVINAFEEASVTTDAEQRRDLLSFVVVGGGATGVEVVGELTEFIDGIVDRYHYCQKDEPKVTLVHASKELLEQFKPSLRKAAQEQLTKEGITVRAETFVTEVTSEGLKLKSGEMIEASTIIWSAGVKALVPKFTDMQPTLTGGRLAVDNYFRILGNDRIFAMGDAAAYIDSHDGPTGRPIPQLAQAAQAQASVVAANLIAAVHGRPMQEFHYHSKGAMVSVGQWFAIGEIYSMKMAGWFTWWLWRTVYLSKFASWKKRVRIALEWFLDIFFPRDITKIG
ncbi:MAG TPA: NAD(P)/FAD-dependent oxidoreductase [Candidatus Paceibacterota bacterium]